MHNDKILSLYYINTRLGEFEVLDSQFKLDAALNKVASGFLGRFIISKDQWCKRVADLVKSKPAKSVRELLMDQKDLCNGIGNYLVAEIMYYAKLHYEVTLGQMQLAELFSLFDVCRQVVVGHYNRSLEKVIYMKSVSPNGNPIVSTQFKGRTAWYCPAEQSKRH